MAKIKDLFSADSYSYAQFRPHYPPELFVHLATLTREHGCAWDCATGNGQAAVALAAHYNRVIATDMSAQQIANAMSHPHVRYYVATAYESGLPDQSVDLITVAQAFHWFDHALFAKEIERVAKPGALLAIWCYGLASITQRLDDVIRYLYSDLLGKFWEPERRLIETNYESAVLPFTPVACGEFVMSATWTLEHLLGYLKTWSALQKYMVQNGDARILSVFEQLAVAWGNEAAHVVRWQIRPRLWRIEPK